MAPASQPRSPRRCLRLRGSPGPRMPRTDHPALRLRAGSLPAIPTDKGWDFWGDSWLPAPVTLSGTARPSRRGARQGADRVPGRSQAGGQAALGSRCLSLSTSFLNLRFKLLLRCALGIPGTWKEKPGTAVPACKSRSSTAAINKLLDNEHLRGSKSVRPPPPSCLFSAVSVNYPETLVNEPSPSLITAFWE